MDLKRSFSASGKWSSIESYSTHLVRQVEEMVLMVIRTTNNSVKIVGKERKIGCGIKPILKRTQFLLRIKVLEEL